MLNACAVLCPTVKVMDSSPEVFSAVLGKPYSIGDCLAPAEACLAQVRRDQRILPVLVMPSQTLALTARLLYQRSSHDSGLEAKGLSQWNALQAELCFTSQSLNPVPSCKSLAIGQSASNQLTQFVASIDAHQNGNRPLLPLAIPVQRNWHSSNPCAKASTNQTTKGLVKG
jgi:hypothetical protein